MNNKEIQEAYKAECLEAIEAMKVAYGSYASVAREMGLSPATISRFRKEGKLYPKIWQWLFENGYIDRRKPPVDPRQRRWIPTNNVEGALRIVSETYDIELYVYSESHDMYISVNEMFAGENNGR